MHISNPPKPDTRPATTEETKQMGLADLRALRHRRRLLMAGGIIVLIVAGIAATPLFTPPPTVAVTTIKAQSTERVLAVTGRVKPRESVQVFPKATGQILRLAKDKGDMVQAGDVLGQVDPARAKSALAQASAGLDAQRRILGQAERDLERARTLLERGSATVAGVETATLAVSKGREDLRRLEAARDDAALRLDEFTIIAPLTGRILNRPVDPGQVIDVRTALFSIAPTGAQEIESEVDEAYSMAIKLGQQARLAFAGLPKPAEGRVSYLAPEIQTSTGGRLMRLTFDAPNGVSGEELPVGLSVDVNVIVDRTADALTVPRQAIRDLATDPHVFVVRDGILAWQNVTFIDWPAQSVIVTSGLKAGDQVVLDQDAPAVGSKVQAQD